MEKHKQGTSKLKRTSISTENIYDQISPEEDLLDTNLPNTTNETLEQKWKRLLNLFKKYLDSTDSKLNQFSFLNKLSIFLGIRKSFILLGIIVFTFFSIQNGIGYTVIFDLLGFYYPAWMTFKSIEIQDNVTNHHWLIYWIVFSFFKLFQYPFDILTFWLPLRGVIKLLLLAYISLPYFNGSNYIFLNLIRPFLVKHQTSVDETLTQFKTTVNDIISTTVSRSTTDNSTSDLSSTEDAKIFLSSEIDKILQNSRKSISHDDFE